MTLTLTSAVQVLNKHKLLRVIIQGGKWSLDPADFPGADTPFRAATYNTKEIRQGSILFCKGAFKAKYLIDSDENGLSAYVAERPYAEAGKAIGLIVSDVRKAMSLLASAFYDYPQRSLKLIGITGTKGKTTTAYFTQALLNAASNGKAALFSSVSNCLDGHTYTDSELTTPESLDAMRMMRAAVDNGMRYLVMEVSSQAYKVNRVYGLTFDIGAFLNISPDHISAIEHPTFMDYFHCKLQLVSNCKTLVLNAQSEHANLIEREASDAHVPIHTFAIHNADETTSNKPAASATHHSENGSTSVTAQALAWPINAQHSEFAVNLDNQKLDIKLNMEGDFNYANATAALCIAQEAGIDVCRPNVAAALEQVRVQGRMEEFKDDDSQTVAIVDYAHNFTSVTALINFAMERYGSAHPRLTLVTGSAGGKAIDRREGIVKAAQGRVSEIILTSDDPDHESAQSICEQMQSHIDNSATSSAIILDRAKAIETAIQQAQTRSGLDIVLIIGKGEESWIKVNGNHVPYAGDTTIVQRLIA